MDIEKTFENLFDNAWDSLDNENYLYGFSSAIYTVWSKGSELEMILSNKLIERWQQIFYTKIEEGYSKTKHNYLINKPRPEYKDYVLSFIKDLKITHTKHSGAVAALEKMEDQEKIQ